MSLPAHDGVRFGGQSDRRPGLNNIDIYNDIVEQ